MSGKSKNSQVPSDAQAREKLAIYVYEYLLHIGAPKAAQTFLSEIRWEKNITLGEPPGFLHTWWSVFWDLYCAAPERRDQCDYSLEAKASHDYGLVGSAGYGNGMGGHPFMRYPGPPRPNVRMSQGMSGDFNGPPGQHMMPGNLDSARQNEAGDVPWQAVPPSIGMRMRGPGMMGMGPNYGPAMRGPPPNSSLVPPGIPPGMGMPGVRPQWPNTSSPMNYSSSSPGIYGRPPGPMMTSPQDLPNPGHMGQDFPMGPMSSNAMGSVLNGDSLDDMKNSPANDGSHTPRDDSGSGMGDYSFVGENYQSDSAAIQKIKESMQEEAKRFEKDSDHPNYFMQ